MGNRLGDITCPDIAGPTRIASEVCSVLSELPFVHRISLFGSLAEDRADGWSDVDMMVACDNVEVNAWVAAKSICLAKPILYYRKFSAREQPLGRYWFVDESPFNRLDISFESPEDYQSRLENPEISGYAITYREIYSGDKDAASASSITTELFLLPASDHETRIGILIYFSLSAIKHHLRTGSILDKDIPRIRGLFETLPTLPRDTVMSGGGIGELAHQTTDMLTHFKLI